MCVDDEGTIAAPAAPVETQQMEARIKQGGCGCRRGGSEVKRRHCSRRRPEFVSCRVAHNRVQAPDLISSSKLSR